MEHFKKQIFGLVASPKVDSPLLETLDGWTVEIFLRIVSRLAGAIGTFRCIQAACTKRVTNSEANDRRESQSRTLRWFIMSTMFHRVVGQII